MRLLSVFTVLLLLPTAVWAKYESKSQAQYLLEDLSSDDRSVVYEALRYLNQDADENVRKEIIPHLLKDIDLHSSALSLLGRKHPDLVIPSVAEHLDQATVDSAENILAQLGQYHPRAILDVILPRASSPNERTRQSVMALLTVAARWLQDGEYMSRIDAVLADRLLNETDEETQTLMMVHLLSPERAKRMSSAYEQYITRSSAPAFNRAILARALSRAGKFQAKAHHKLFEELMTQAQDIKQTFYWNSKPLFAALQVIAADLKLESRLLAMLVQSIRDRTSEQDVLIAAEMLKSYGAQLKRFEGELNALLKAESNPKVRVALEDALEAMTSGR